MYVRLIFLVDTREISFSPKWKFRPWFRAGAKHKMGDISFAINFMKNVHSV